MKLLRLVALTTLGLGLGGAARAETKVELKGTHLCCPQCVRAVGEILKKVDGVTGTCDQKAGTVSITARDDAAAQQALDALAAGGFHGDTGHKDLRIKDDSGVQPGQVKTLTLVGIHNCCGACNRAINATLKKVEGVDSFQTIGGYGAVTSTYQPNFGSIFVRLKPWEERHGPSLHVLIKLLATITLVLAPLFI